MAEKETEQEELQVHPEEQTEGTREQQGPSLEDQLAAEKDKYVRLYAEFANSKKMWEKQKIECLKFGSFNILKDFASILDDIEAATATLNVEKHKEYAEGLTMVYKKIKEVLEDHGLQEIETEGKPFDPHVHEALMFEENNDVDEHTVVGVIQKGYAIEGKILRPARVKVSKKPATS